MFTLISYRESSNCCLLSLHNVLLVPSLCRAGDCEERSSPDCIPLIPQVLLGSISVIQTKNMIVLMVAKYALTIMQLIYI